MDRLTSMEVFVAAVDLGSFAAAATELGMSAPMVGKHVRSLEEQLDVRLINRTTRRQTLTEFGQTFYERSRAILADVEAVGALAADQFSEPHGRLRMTMPVHFGRRCVLPSLMQLARQYPGLEFDLQFSDRTVEVVEDGFDLAIRTGAPGGKAGLMTRRVARQPMILCAAPLYLDARGCPSHLQELPDHRVLNYRRSGPAMPWLFARKDGGLIEVLPKGRMQFDDLDAIADAAIAAMGIAWLPYWLVRDVVRSGKLQQVLKDEGEYLYDVYALWAQTPRMPRKLRLVIDALATTLPTLMSDPGLR